ncbi:YeeE/YedE family protein [Desulfurivibrio sp. D14AmB]|uniref:YeeE/YedE family protein n=1 Tax=Desulfurivibrio sp. D14AmB TaxID=3374370 RepID=UPI00376EE5AE
MITGSLVLIVLTGLLLGLTAGFVMHRSDYCVAGMFRDAFLFGRYGGLRILFLQVVVTMLLFELARQAGLLPLYPFPILAPPALVNLLGGMVFGLGMVLAGGCVFGTLYKMGAGSVVSAVAFLGLILGSGLYALIHPWWKELARATILAPERITLPQLLNLDPLLPLLFFWLPALFLLWRWGRQGLLRRPVSVAGYLQPWQAATILAVIGLASYLLVGMPMGVTTSFTKLAAMGAAVVAPEWVAGQSFFQAVSLDVLHPASGARLTGGPGPRPDLLFAIQLPLAVGVVLGSTLSAVMLREFAVYLRVPLRQLLSALAGGILMGLAARMVPACNVWHLMGGLPIMVMQSILFLLGIFPGTWLGVKLFRLLVR